MLLGVVEGAHQFIIIAQNCKHSTQIVVVGLVSEAVAVDLSPELFKSLCDAETLILGSLGLSDLFDGLELLSLIFALI